MQLEASKQGPDHFKPPAEVAEFDKRSEVVFYDHNHNPVEVAYGIVVFS